MAYNLLLDTTQDTLMLALVQENTIFTTLQEGHDSQRYHSAILLPKIQQLFDQAGIGFPDLTGVAVNRGPGSFTGIRTGLTMARLMGQFSDLPLFGFSTFELIAAHPQFLGQSVSIFLNAFRQQHYLAELEVGQSGTIHWIQEARVLPNETPSVVKSDYCVMESSLSGKLSVTHSNLLMLGDLALFTPEMMQFYLSRQADSFRYSWQFLKPLYLQMPQITLSQ
jgi:tRNA threonylcarbamoyladenosine biosynthesis protein TsaB